MSATGINPDGSNPSVAGEIWRVGTVSSSLVALSQAPRQADEGAPGAWLVFEPWVSEAVRDLHPGAEILVVTWLHRARRDVLTVHPRGDISNPKQGVFSTRSPQRPNPVGIHRTRVVARDGSQVEVEAIEAIDGTPIIDVKPVLDAAER